MEKAIGNTIEKSELSYEQSFTNPIIMIPVATFGTVAFGFMTHGKEKSK